MLETQDKDSNAHVISVVVQYVGKIDYRDDFAPNVVFQAVKVHAMKHFELDPSSADRYVLQYNGTDMSDRGHLADLHAPTVTLTLALEDEVPKG